MCTTHKIRGFSLRNIVVSFQLWVNISYLLQRLYIHGSFSVKAYTVDSLFAEYNSESSLAVIEIKDL